MTYSEKLRDPRWQKKRLEILQRDDFTCQSCKSKKKTLHIHHTHYESLKEPWNYPNKQLITLCDDCHAKEKIDGLIESLRKCLRSNGIIKKDFEESVIWLNGRSKNYIFKIKHIGDTERPLTIKEKRSVKSTLSKLFSK